VVAPSSNGHHIVPRRKIGRSCFCRFAAPNAENVRDANEVVGAPFARIVAAAIEFPPQSGVTTTKEETP
jgi:hypothetical protein